MTTQIQRATSADIGSLLTLMHDFYAESGFDLNHESTATAFQSLLSDPSLGCIWLAYANNIAIGHTVLTVRFTMEHEGLSGYIDDLYVQPQHRRLGVGRGLLNELLAECRARRCKALHVEVGKSNLAALALYTKLGLHAATDGRILASGAVPGEGA